MAKTSRAVQQDFYELLQESPLRGAITGGIYRDGLRPRDSRLEDLIVIFTAGRRAQIEEGVVTLNLFVPDIDPYEDGTWREDTRRTQELEQLLDAWASSLSERTRGGYLFHYRDTIQTLPAHERQQHFISLKLSYEYFSEE